MRETSVEQNKLRPAGKKKDLYNPKKHLKSCKNALFTKNSNSNSGGNNSVTIVCYILVPSREEKLINKIFENKEGLNRIIKKYMDFVIVGYDKEGVFQEAVFYDFIRDIENQTQWRWKEKAQIIIAKMDTTQSIMKYVNGHIFTVYIDEVIEDGYAQSLSELINKIVCISLKSDNVDTFIKSVKRNFRNHQIFQSVKRNRHEIINGIGKGGTLLFQWFLGIK